MMLGESKTGGARPGVDEPELGREAASCRRHHITGSSCTHHGIVHPLLSLNVLSLHGVQSCASMGAAETGWENIIARHAGPAWPTIDFLQPATAAPMPFKRLCLMQDRSARLSSKRILLRTALGLLAGQLQQLLQGHTDMGREPACTSTSPKPWYFHLQHACSY